MAENSETTPTALPPAPAGFAPVLGALNGLNQVASGVGGLIDTGANAAEDIARGKAAIANQRLDAADREMSLALRMQQFKRGDNKLVILAVAASAVALIMLTR